MVIPEKKDILENAARAAGEVLRAYFQGGLDISLKTDIHDLVTEADHKAQDAVVSSIQSEIKKSSIHGRLGFLGEEGLYSPGEYLFVIDPLDGTTNFAAGLPYFSVSIAILKDNKPFAGVVYQVVEDKMYYGAVGEGAYLNNKRFYIPAMARMQDCFAITNLSKKEGVRKLRLKQIAKVYPNIRTIRVFGSIALDICSIAVGAGDIAWAGGAIWDLVAADVIISEAGGEVVGVETGAPLVYTPENTHEYYQFIAGNKKLTRTFRTYLS